MAYFYDFCANDVFVSLLLCSKWDVNTILIRALSRTPLLHLSRERTKTPPYTLFEYDNTFAKASWKVQVRELFRKNIQDELNKNYSFYAITPREGVNAEQFIQQNFQQLLGKVYTPYGETGNQAYYSVALDNGERFANENERTLSLLAPYFYVEKCPVGTSPETVLPKVEQQATGAAVPTQLFLLQDTSQKESHADAPERRLR